MLAVVGGWQRLFPCPSPVRDADGRAKVRASRLTGPFPNPMLPLASDPAEGRLGLRQNRSSSVASAPPLRGQSIGGH